MKIKIKEDDILDQFLVCPYCMETRTFDHRGCCGESRDHFETAYATMGGDLFLETEIEIIKENENEIK